MSKILLRFVHEFKDRHGKTRRYFRRPGFKRAPLPGLPGSEEFMRAYQSALDLKTAQRIEIGAARVAAGTVADLVARYYRSTEFLGLKASTQSTYRSIIEPFRGDHGDKRVALLKRQHVKDMLAKKAGTPTAANNWLKRVRQLMAFARDIGMRADDPTIGVKPLPIRSLGHPAWSVDDIAAFRRRAIPQAPVRGWRWRWRYARCSGAAILFAWGASISRAGCSPLGRRRPGP
jgi:hypothetical protein